jgi:hypothetical protein
MEAWLRRSTLALMVLALVLGASLRIFSWARNPSFWIDEAMLALNVVHRPYAELLQPLDLNQGAPVGYLLMSKAMMKTFGPSEYALRFPSLVAGLASLAFMVRFAHKFLPLASAQLASAALALSPFMAGYSAEFKQYELDATIALGLIMLARDATTPWRLVGLGSAGMLAVWFSHPALFTLGGIGAAYAHELWRTRDYNLASRRGVMIGGWLMSFAVCWYFFTSRLGMNAYLLDYWAGTFAPLPPRSPGDLAWYVHHFLELFQKPGGFATSEFGVGGIAALCWVIGVVALRREHPSFWLSLTVPLALVLLASGLKKYPFAGRLLLFCIPAMIVVVAHGAMVIAERLKSITRMGPPVLITLLLLPGIAECWWQVKKPIHAEDARELVAYLHAEYQPGDPVYVYYGAVPAYAFYAGMGPIPTDEVQFGEYNRGGDARRFHQELTQYLGQSRVWIVMVHKQTTEEAAIRSYLDAHGKCEASVRKSDASLYRYDLSRPIAANAFPSQKR